MAWISNVAAAKASPIKISETTTRGVRGTTATGYFMTVTNPDGSKTTTFHQTGWKEFRQADTVTRWEYRGLTESCAKALVDDTALNYMTTTGNGSVSDSSVCEMNRANDASGYTVTRTLTHTEYY